MRRPPIEKLGRALRRNSAYWGERKNKLGRRQKNKIVESVVNV